MEKLVVSPPPVVEDRQPPVVQTEFNGLFNGLYDFQSICIKEVYAHIRQNTQRILLVAPCATGKTTMASQVIYDATKRAKKPIRCMFLVSLTCLIDQAAEALQNFGVDCSVLQGGREFDPQAQVVVASIQTIQSRIKKQGLGEILGSFGVIFET